MPPLVQCKETNPDKLVLCRVQPGQVPAKLLWLSQRNALYQTDCTEYSGQSCAAGVLNCNNALGASTTKSQTTGSHQMEVQSGSHLYPLNMSALNQTTSEL